MNLKDANLFRTENLVDGFWRGAGDVALMIDVGIFQRMLRSDVG